MIQVLYDKMALPPASHLGKRVFKKLFYDHGQLGETDKRAFTDDIGTITWQYTLKPSTIPIQPYEDDEREYLEIAVLQVDLKTFKRTQRIVEIIHRTIPYPLLLVLTFERIGVDSEPDEYLCALSLAPKRLSRAEQAAVVVEEFLITPWIDLSNPTSIQREFIDSLDASSLTHTHFYAYYMSLVDRLVALNCARLTGEYRLEPGRERRETRRDLLKACHRLEVQIAEQRAALKKESQFNRQVELNTRIKRLEQKLRHQAAEL